MEQLIWFSVPGAVFLPALIVFFPALLSEGNPVLLVVLVPIAGYIIHEAYRLVFDLTGGYARSGRRVVDHLMNDIAPQYRIKLNERRQAFLVWELTVYGKDFPEPYVIHNSRYWHNLHSFGSTFLSAVLAALACLGTVFLRRCDNLASRPLAEDAGLAFGVVELIVLVLMGAKGITSFGALVAEEIAVVDLHKSKFVATLTELYGPPVATTAARRKGGKHR